MPQDSTTMAGVPTSPTPAQTTSECAPRLSHVLRGRKLWLKLQLYIGLVVGFESSLVGLTSRLLVLYKAIDTWLNPNLLTTAGSGARLSIDDIFAAAQAAIPHAQSPAAAVEVRLPGGVDWSYLAWVKVPGATAEEAHW